jgi:hypothetical protein
VGQADGTLRKTSRRDDPAGDAAHEELIRIVAPHFVAGVVFAHDEIVRAAPIVQYMARNRWNFWRVLSYCEEKRWELEVVG